MLGNMPSNYAKRINVGLKMSIDCNLMDRMLVMYLQQHLLCKHSIHVRMCFLYVQMCDLCHSIEGIRLKSPPTCKTFFPLFLLWTLGGFILKPIFSKKGMQIIPKRSIQPLC